MLKSSLSTRHYPARIFHTLHSRQSPSSFAAGRGLGVRFARSSTPEEPSWMTSTPPAPSTESPFPPTFYSLYRLLLRSTSASVLSQPHATSTLRSLWRPVFVQAASIMARYMDTRLRPSRIRRNALNEWLREWDRRSKCHLLWDPHHEER